MDVKCKNQKISILGQNFFYAGLWAIYIHICSQIIAAQEKGYIPIVNLKTNANCLFKDNKVLKDNTWEYFFKQPFNIGLEDINENAEIIFGNNEEQTPYKYQVHPIHLPSDLNSNFKEHPYAKENAKFCQLSDEMEAYCQSEYNRIIGNETEVLGILCRGTDYLKLRPYNHVIQPTPEEVITKAKELKSKLNYKKIYLATEDTKIYKLFKDEFKDILIENEQYKYSDIGNNLLNFTNKEDEENFLYNLNKEYMRSIYILSKCPYFIGGKTSGTVGVYLLSNLFKNKKYVYLWYTGKYKVGNIINYKNIFEKFFSIKNETYEDKKWKVITIFGIKLKLRKKGIKTNL